MRVVASCEGQFKVGFVGGERGDPSGGTGASQRGHCQRHGEAREMGMRSQWASKGKCATKQGTQTVRRHVEQTHVEQTTRVPQAREHWS